MDWRLFRASEHWVWPMSPNWLKKPLKHQFLTATQGKEIDLAVLTKRKMTWLTSLAEVSTMKDWEREKRPQGKYFEICPGNASEMWNSDNWERRIFPLFPPQYLRRILLNPHLFKVFKCSNKTDNIMGRAAGIASLTFFSLSYSLSPLLPRSWQLWVSSPWATCPPPAWPRRGPRHQSCTAPPGVDRHPENKDFLAKLESFTSTPLGSPALFQGTPLTHRPHLPGRSLQNPFKKSYFSDIVCCWFLLTHPYIIVPVENLGRQNVSLTVLLLTTIPHIRPVILVEKRKIWFFLYKSDSDLVAWFHDVDHLKLLFSHGQNHYDLLLLVFKLNNFKL